eukprot:2275955-Pleurochrysis_carterae.AAC.2
MQHREGMDATKVKAAKGARSNGYLTHLYRMWTFGVGIRDKYTFAKGETLIDSMLILTQHIRSYT